ncbi:MAG: FadR family transcriptional regulator [Subtercola sp.]|nr:FadR family transcriptional regulator [Subtercola sp.]
MTASAPKRAEELARELEAVVMDHGWVQGEYLGSEAELVARYQVSRAVFREAVRIIEHHGAAEMKRGPRGGLVVSSPELRSVQRPTTLWLDYANVTTLDLSAVRSTLELTCVRIVATNVTDESAALLRTTLAAERAAGLNGVREGRSHELHILIARLSNNPALLLFVETMANLAYERAQHLEYRDEQADEVFEAHDRVVDAIIAGDPALAQHRMRKHLSAATHYYRDRENAPEGQGLTEQRGAEQRGAEQRGAEQ